MIEETPILVETKAIREDSGGAGRFRGGNGQVMAIQVLNPTPLTVSFLSDRTRVPAPGLHGGQDGALGAVTLNGNPINPKETVIVQSGDLIVLSTPGGAGYGDAREPDLRLVADDVVEGVVSAAQASAQYGWRGV